MNFNGVLIFVELCEVRSVFTILVDHLGVSIKESNTESVLVVLGNLVVKGLLSAVVILGGQVKRLESTWSRDLHGV